MWKLVSIHLEIVLILMQDSCIVYTERTIGLEIVWTHPIEHLCDVGLVKSHDGPFRDGVSVSAR
jgi:hypothetical protein